MNENTELHWLVRPNTIKLLWRVGFGILGLLVLADFVVHPHAVFGIEASFGFFSWYGLLTCFGMILFSKFLSIFLKRKDTYYDD
tara:strand:- start:256 stop:507 length:252 start_codon:yes stop_codon:yes gene_type:complete